MIVLTERTWLSVLLRYFPPIGRWQDAQNAAALEWAMEHPDEPVIIGGEYFPTGAGVYRGDEVQASGIALRQK
jgi:hypothetical protein